jgi:exodeoxyribonuclease VIII
MSACIIYDMAATGYRAALGVSKSALDDFAKCPAWYHAKHVAKEVEREETAAMQYGTLLHSLILDGKASYHTKPDGVSFVSKEGNAWREAHQDLPIISQAESDSLQRTAGALLKHPVASKLFGEGRSEVSMFGIHAETNTIIKGRADWIGSGRIVDIKTTADASNKGLSKSIYNFGYHRQAWLYMELAKQNALDLKQFVFIAIEKGPVPLINVRALSPAAIEQGGIEINSQLRDLAECRRTGIWKDYSADNIGEIDLPTWAYNDTTGMELIGAIPTDESEELDILP